MIRIIKQDPHKDVLKEVVCRNCGVTLEYTPSDETKKSGTAGLGDSWTQRHIKCPSCSHKIITYNR